MAGFNQEEIESMDIHVDDETFKENVRRKLLGAMLNNGSSQKVIKVSEVEEYISER